METAIEVCNISKKYNLYKRHQDRFLEALNLTRKKLHTEHYALNNVSLEIVRGETVGIIGANGAGKSTLLKIITGVINPSEGSVRVNGHISALLELGAGFNREYTGIENIYLQGIMAGFSKEEIEERVEEIIRFADIGEYINQPVKMYSSGMFVRLAFAVAINIDPEILIVDEALSVGDIFFQQKCYNKFNDFKEKGKTILLVSHDLGSIIKYCDRAIVIDNGQKIAEGPPNEMVDLYKKVLVNMNKEQDELGEKPNEAVLQSEIRWKSQLLINPYINEYGNKKAEIEDFAIVDNNGQITNTLIKGSSFQIRMKVRFHEIICDPIMAFTITDIRSTELTGTNTLLEKIKIPINQAGEVKTATFTQIINLQGGNYFLSLGCTGFMNGEFQAYHRLYNVCHITVIAEKNSVGVYDMNSDIEIR